MSTGNFIMTYVQACATGKLSAGECGPMWQMAVIAALLVLAIGALLFLRLRAGAATQE